MATAQQRKFKKAAKACRGKSRRAFRACMKKKLKSKSRKRRR